MPKRSTTDTPHSNPSTRPLLDMIPIEVVDEILQDLVAELIHHEFTHIESGNEEGESYREIIDKIKTFNCKPILNIANTCHHFRAVVVVVLARVSICPRFEFDPSSSRALMTTIKQIDAFHGMCYCYAKGAFDAVEPHDLDRSDSLVEKHFKKEFLDVSSTPLWMIYMRITILNTALPIDQIRHYMGEVRSQKLAILDEIKPCAKAFLHRGVATLEDVHTDHELYLVFSDISDFLRSLPRALGNLNLDHDDLTSNTSNDEESTELTDLTQAISRYLKEMNGIYIDVSFYPSEALKDLHATIEGIYQIISEDFEGHIYIPEDLDEKVYDEIKCLQDDLKQLMELASERINGENWEVINEDIRLKLAERRRKMETDRQS